MPVRYNENKIGISYKNVTLYLRSSNYSGGIDEE